MSANMRCTAVRFCAPSVFHTACSFANIKQRFLGDLYTSGGGLVHLKFQKSVKLPLYSTWVARSCCVFFGKAALHYSLRVNAGARCLFGSLRFLVALT